MDFNFTDEQKLLLESVQRFVERDYSFEIRRAHVKDKVRLDRAVWQVFAELGWLGVGVPEELGGFGGNAVEIMLVAEALGKGQVIEPYSMCSVYPAAILTAPAVRENAAALLESLVAGESVFAVAHSEPAARGEVAHVTATAMPKAGGWVLNGHKSLVVGGDVADRLIVSARTAGGANDEDGISLFLVNPKSANIRIEGDGLVDWTSGVDVIFDNLELAAEALLLPAGTAYPVLRDAVDKTIIALVSEAVGAIEGAIDTTAPYLKLRKQFGVSLSTFQVLQHRMSDMAIDLVQARSALYRGLEALTFTDAEKRSAHVSGCKALVTRLGKTATAQGIQLHGGYGITEEYSVGHFYKRLLVVDALFGRQDYHLGRYTKHMVAGMLANA